MLAAADPVSIASLNWPSAGWYATLPLWPLLGAVLSGVLIALRRRAELAHWPVVIGAGLAAVVGVALFFHIPQLYAAARELAPPHSHSHATVAAGVHAKGASTSAAGEEHAVSVSVADPGFTYTVFNWISFGAAESLAPASNRWIAVNFYFDGLTGVMSLFFTLVALMVVIYAVGYMRDHHGHPEPGYERFFVFLGLFIFSMGMLVYAGNFVLLYLGWEAVGLCSYLLIGFYYGRPEAAAAAKKAFIVNRIGDLGFALGIFCLYSFIRPYCQPGENPLDFATVFKYAALMASADSGFLGLTQSSLVSLLLMCGAVGKSAQFPLYVWLPDAMEGPTPVSALIHAATMVTAGIYMIARCGPIFAASPLALDVITVLGLIGALLTATMACAQYDMKRILAYSTISQLAFMFVALGCAAPHAGVFHVFTHAWFKALLFLGAGAVMHAMGGVIDVRRFSGLRHVLPHTYAVMLVGCLALAGFPLLSGFWSKDEILHAAWHRHWLVGALLLACAGLTSYYTFRMFFLCFHGRLRLPAEAGEHPHESGPVMTVPLYVLAAGAVFAGYLGVHLHASASGSFLGFLAPHGYFHSYLADSTLGAAHHAEGGIWLAYVSAAVALAGILLAWRRYGAAPQVDPDERALGPLFRLWNAKYYVDEIYEAIFVRPLRAAGRFFFATDNYGVDGAVWTVSAVPRVAAFALHFFQRGALQAYAACMVIGLVALLWLWSWWAAAPG
ncbi:MAG: NADH-quinone oxidoreductase subunit L [Phycisphaerales bacterium]|nr:NADH-quinone oxidoreductase subunit L [Phycisphaerales bacterium]